MINLLVTLPLKLLTNLWEASFHNHALEELALCFDSAKVVLLEEKMNNTKGFNDRIDLTGFYFALLDLIFKIKKKNLSLKLLLSMAIKFYIDLTMIFSLINNRIRTEWCPIRSVITLLLTLLCIVYIYLLSHWLKAFS